MATLEHIRLVCSNGTVRINRKYIEKCDHASHLLRGKEKLLNFQSDTFQTIDQINYAKKHPVEIIIIYFDLYRKNEFDLENNTILQLIDLILSDGRGEIYKSQRQTLSTLCSIIGNRAAKSGKESQNFSF